MKKMGCVLLLLFVVALAIGLIMFAVLSDDEEQSDSTEATTEEMQEAGETKPEKVKEPKEEKKEMKEAKPEAEKSAKKPAKVKTVARLGAEHVYSHRGASGEAEEHSFEAYDLAISYGSVNIEQDVVTSADGTLYVSHDRSPYRLTGVSGDYSDMTDEEIDELRTYAGNKILKLSEVFDRYGDSINYIIELKSKDPGAVDAFRKLVDEYENEDQIVVQCFARGVLAELEEYYPDMPKLYLCKQRQYFEEGCQLPYVDILSVSKDMMTEANCELAHRAGKQFDVWVLDTEDEIRKAIDLGVDTYFTDYTKLALDLEDTYGEEVREE